MAGPVQDHELPPDPFKTKRRQVPWSELPAPSRALAWTAVCCLIVILASVTARLAMEILGVTL